MMGYNLDCVSEAVSKISRAPESQGARQRVPGEHEGYSPRPWGAPLCGPRLPLLKMAPGHVVRKRHATRAMASVVVLQRLLKVEALLQRAFTAPFARHSRY